MSENAHPDSAAELARFYRETILRHTANPVGFRAAIDATHRAELYNPTCGDRVILQFEVKNDHVEAAAFDGESCGICMASASILCDVAPGHPTGDVRNRHDWLEHTLKSGEDVQTLTEQANDPGQLKALLGVRRYPTRVNCALLPWQAALKALEN